MERLVRKAVLGTMVLLAAMAVAQMPPSHGSGQGMMPSSRTDFAQLCGIADPSVEASRRLTRSARGEWRIVSSNARPEATDSGVARVWHQGNWMVDLHDAPGSGMNVTQMHTGQMCFDPGGRAIGLIDRYMDMQGCGCMRYTVLHFDLESGRVMRREQKFIGVQSGAPIAEPESAKSFPEVWPYRRLEQLPFYKLILQ